MHPDRVFVRKVQDLRRRSDLRPDDNHDAGYEVLMAAPLLREFLFGDPMPLIDHVNRERRVRLRFQVARKPAYEKLVLSHKPAFYQRGDGLFPGHNMMPGSEIADLTRDQLLREMVMMVQGSVVTVHQLIDYVANAAGAQHYAELTKHKRALLQQIDSSLVVGGFEPAVLSLRSVGLIVADGLQPLVERIEADAA